MAISIEQLIAELRTFREKRAIVNGLARAVRAAAKPVRAKIKERALATLPQGGGLNRWVARISVTAQTKVFADRASIKLKGGRNAQGGRADMTRIDAGWVRAPSWGHKTKAAWHNVAVTPGFFTRTADDPVWHDGIDRAVDEALDQLRG